MRVLILIGLLGLSACHSGWNQDPFDGQEENVKNAVPQGGNKVQIPPIQDVMRVDVKDTFVVREGESLNVGIDYRLLHPEFIFKGLELRDLENELPGATYNPQTRELNFQPEEGYVTGGLVVSHVLRVTLLAEYKGLIQERRKDLVFHIVKGSAEAPVIERIDNLGDTFFEGDRKAFQIYVRDEVSSDGPILVVGNYSPTNKNGAHFIEYDKKGRKVSGDPTLWRFNAAVDLSSPEMSDITSSSDLFRVEVQAFSQLGVPANLKNFNFYVFTKANRPQFFMDRDEVNFTVGEQGQYSFLVVDPGQEGEVTANFVRGCPTQAECLCEGGKGAKKSLARCSVRWIPTMPGRNFLFIEAKNTVLSYDQNTMNHQTETANLVINVIQKGAQ